MSKQNISIGIIEPPIHIAIPSVISLPNAAIAAVINKINPRIPKKSEKIRTPLMF